MTIRSKCSTGRYTRSSSLAKFTLFLLFTAAYCYFSYLSMPAAVSSTTQTDASNNQIHRPNTTTKQHLHTQITVPGPEVMYDWSTVETDLEERKELVQNVCRSGIVPKMIPNAWEFVIDAKHSLIWCNIFKAASSSWMYNFNILGGYPDTYLQVMKKNPITLLRARFPRPTVHQLMTSLPTSLSFLIVRDPFHRLLSAYRDKLETVQSPHYGRLANVIVARYRKRIGGRVNGGGPTFKEFVRYVTDTRDRPNEHWAPFYKFCTPCAVNFTVIAKTETLSRDQSYIIHQQRLQNILTPKRLKHLNQSKGGLHPKDLIRKYYSKLDTDLLDKLVDIYSIDFLMFGYNATEYYDFIPPSNQ